MNGHPNMHIINIMNRVDISFISISYPLVIVLSKSGGIILRIFSIYRSKRNPMIKYIEKIINLFIRHVPVKFCYKYSYIGSIADFGKLWFKSRCKFFNSTHYCW